MFNVHWVIVKDKKTFGTDNANDGQLFRSQGVPDIARREYHVAGRAGERRSKGSINKISNYLKVP